MGKSYGEKIIFKIEHGYNGLQGFSRDKQYYIS